MYKSEKVEVINAWLSMQLLKATNITTAEEENEETYSSYDEDTVEDTELSDEETDIVTHEIGMSDSDSSEEDDNSEQEIVQVTRSGRHVHKRKFYWDY